MMKIAPCRSRISSITESYLLCLLKVLCGAIGARLRLPSREADELTQAAAPRYAATRDIVLTGLITAEVENSLFHCWSSLTRRLRMASTKSGWPVVVKPEWVASGLTRAKSHQFDPKCCG